MTRERPILFSAPMVRAILDGRKTQTRRVVKMGRWRLADGVEEFAPPLTDCPYGAPGDRLWVRETWAAHRHEDSLPPRDCSREVRFYFECHKRQHGSNPRIGKWRPSIHMPRWHSRITMAITSVRVERLNDISEADAIAEGILKSGDGWRGADGLPWFASPVGAYRSLWESINGAGSWDANPWVWVVEFKRVEQS